MAAAAAASTAATASGGSGRGRGRPRGSGSGSKSSARSARSRRSKSRSMRWSKPPKRGSRPPPSASPASGSSPPVHSPAAGAGAGPDLNQPLPPGTEVEVRVDDEGFHGSWFEATVLGFTPAGKGYRNPARYTVKYVHLLADDDEGVLAEHFAPSHIRPRPPPPPPPPSSSPSPPAPRFQIHDIVEAFHHEGWWSGIVLSDNTGSSPDSTDTVTVAFPITREVIDFPPSLVRPRRDYVDGDWIPSTSAMAVRPKGAPVRVYAVGDKVEVVRQREAYGESWFPATVRFVVDDLSYVVEYFDLEEEGEEGPEKATEYLHWKFIRPAVEHSPAESEFQFGPGAAVEAYCDGAWSPGVVRRVIGEGEYEIGIAAKKSEMLVTKVKPLLKPQYKWNGKQWRIAAPKRRAKSRRQSVSGKSPRSPVELSSDEEHTPGKNTLAKGSEHASVSEMETPLSALCKSPESTHSPNSVPMNGLRCASPGHSAPVDNPAILSDMAVTDGELNEPVSGRSADDHDTLSITQLRKKMASARGNSAVTHKHKIIVRSVRADINAGKPHPIQELQEKRDIVLALSVSENGRTIPSPDRLVSIGTKRGSSTKVLACKKLAKRRGSKQLCSPNSSLDVTGTIQQRGRKEVAEPMEECPLALGCRKSGTQENITELLNQGLLPMVPPGFKSTDNGKGTNIHDTRFDQENITELLNQGLLPMVPPGFKSTDNGKGTNIHDTQFDEEPTGTINSLIEPKGNGDLCTDHAATNLAESNHVTETAMVSLDCPAEQARGEVNERSVLQNAGSSQCITRCSAFENLLPSPQPLSQVSSHHALFVKNSPMWHLVEAMNVFKELPQQPHFLTLEKYPPGLREGYALGLMLSYADLVKITTEASLDNSMEWFEDKIKTLSHLGENGFIVDFLQSAMAELVKLKTERTSYHGEIGKLDMKIVEKTASSSRVAALLEEKDMAAAELERELGRIRQESQRIAEEKEKIDAEAASMKTARSGFLELCSGAESKCNEVMSLSKKRKNEIMFALQRKKLS